MPTKKKKPKKLTEAQQLRQKNAELKTRNDSLQWTNNTQARALDVSRAKAIELSNRLNDMRGEIDFLRNTLRLALTK